MKSLLICRDNKYKGKKDGVIALVVVTVMAIIMILFASLMNRVRQESAFTNKISVNEAVYQSASSLGRFIAAKITKDLEYRNEPVGLKLSEAITGMASSASSSPVNKTLDFSPLETIKNYKVVEEALRKISEEARMAVELEDVTLSLENVVSIDTPVCEGATRLPGELLGELVIDVKFKIGNVRKTYKTVKDFKYVCLIPYPYARFTLFAPNFAAMKDDRINGVLVNASGWPQDPNKKPLLCLNKRTENNPDDFNSVDDTDSNNKVEDFDKMIKNGWIYLGGAPGGQAYGNLLDFEVDKDTNIKAFALNILPYHGTELPRNSSNMNYGESFHFYYTSDSSGWIPEADWSDFFSSNSVQGVSMRFLKYGFFKDVFDSDFPYPRRRPDGTVSKNKDDYPKVFIYDRIPGRYHESSSEPDFGISLQTEGKTQSSSILPFGTARLCTPTLVFGPVLRRYLIGYALHGIREGGTNLVFPYPGTSTLGELVEAMDAYLVLNESKSESEKKAITNAYKKISWYRDPSANYADFFKVNNGLPSPSPRINHTEAYMYCFENLCAPLSPHKEFEEIVYNFPGNAKLKPFTDSKKLVGSDLAQTPIFGDFNFSAVASENYINYSGRLSELDNALPRGLNFGDRVSYELKPPEGETDFNISKSYFFQKHFVIRKSKISLFQKILQAISDAIKAALNWLIKITTGKSPETSDDVVSELYLNQVVKITLPPGGKLIIDKPIFVRTGGIIDCGDGDIVIKAPILNEEISIDPTDIEPSNATSPPKFPFLTLVGKNITIDTGKGDANLKKVWDATVGSDAIRKRPYALPQLHAILIAKNELKLERGDTSKGINVVGSIAANRLHDSFLYSGSIVEWGLDPDQMSGADVSNNFGLTLSPRTREDFLPSN